MLERRAHVGQALCDLRTPAVGRSLVLAIPVGVRSAGLHQELLSDGPLEPGHGAPDPLHFGLERVAHLGGFQRVQPPAVPVQCLTDLLVAVLYGVMEHPNHLLMLLQGGVDSAARFLQRSGNQLLGLANRACIRDAIRLVARAPVGRRRTERARGGTEELDAGRLVRRRGRPRAKRLFRHLLHAGLEDACPLLQALNSPLETINDGGHPDHPAQRQCAERMAVMGARELAGAHGLEAQTVRDLAVRTLESCVGRGTLGPDGFLCAGGATSLGASTGAHGIGVRQSGCAERGLTPGQRSAFDAGRRRSKPRSSSSLRLLALRGEM
mmetsp:Transcript_759/g.1658  ORF Transcript_759/g.1658 Transcript_759/m.1658 type:complete len:324 (+) Transcript_759:602-1573(+)